MMSLVNVFTSTYNTDGQLIEIRVRGADVVEGTNSIIQLVGYFAQRIPRHRVLNPDTVTGYIDLYLDLRSSTALTEAKRAELHRVLDSYHVSPGNVFQRVYLADFQSQIQFISAGGNDAGGLPPNKVVTYFVDP